MWNNNYEIIIAVLIFAPNLLRTLIMIWCFRHHLLSNATAVIKNMRIRIAIVTTMNIITLQKIPFRPSQSDLKIT